jgi:hypothetical protein
MSLVCLQAQESSPAEINARSRDLMVRVQAALVGLSKTFPVLQGIESQAIQQPDGQYRDKYVYQVFEFTKNAHVVEISHPPLSNQPLPTGPGPTQIPSYLDPSMSPAGSTTIVDPNGIDLFVAVESGWPHRQITKAFELPMGNSTKFYYYIGTNSKDDKTITDAEKKAIQTVLDPFGAEFVALFSPHAK